jgi:hypothetical protein
MQLVLDGRNHGKRKHSNKRLERFHKLKDRLERKNLELKRLDNDMDALMEVYRTRVLPIEAEEVDPLSRLAERLTVFMSRKSLGKGDRDELAEWFWETVNTIRSFQPERADKLAYTFEETVASAAGLTKEELDELVELHERYAREFEESVHEFHRDSRDDSAPDIDLEHPDFFGFDESDEETADTGEAFQSTPTDGVAPERLINGDWIRGIFRRTAHALHPDREPDVVKRQDKHALMTRLLSARKEEDVITILELYCEHVAGGELQVADAELDTICQLMANRIDALQSEKDQRLHADSLESMVYELLHGKSKRLRERKLERLIDDIRARAGDLVGLVGDLRNLDCLREVLRARRYAAIDLMREVESYYDLHEEEDPFSHRPPF